MAATTLIPPKPLDTKETNSLFKKSSKSFNQTQKSVQNISKLLNTRIKVRKQIFSDIFETKRRREFDTRRMEREDEREARRSIPSGTSNVVAAVSKTGGSLIGRLVKALGFIAAGWILRTLPTWIGYAKEFIARVNEIGRIIKSFVTNVGNIFQSSFRVLTSLKDNILKFDFLDSERKLRNSFTELGNSIEGLQKDFKDIIDVFTTDITKEIDGVKVGSYSGEEIPEPGEGFTDSSGTSSQTTPTGYGNVFELIAGGEGGYESINRGRAGDSPGGAKKYLGKDLRDMTLSEIMSLQARGKVFAVGKYQIIDKTMPGFIKFLQTKGYDPSKTKFSESIQDLYPEYTITSKRPIVGKYLRGESGVTVEDAAQELAREFASVGLSRPEAGRGVGQSRYAGTAGNKASISPQQVQQALRQARESGSSTSAKVIPQQSALPNLPPTDTLPGGVQRYGASRDGGTRKHAGVDFDISGPNAKFYSRIGGVVVGSPFRYGDDGWAIDIYNKQLGVYERIAEAAKVLVKPGQTVNPGDAVVQGESNTGVIHYEIRKKIEGGFENSVDPIAFLKGASTSGTAKPVSQQAQISSAPTQQRQQAVAQQITPERKGQDIAVVVPPSQQPQQSVASSGGSSQQSSGTSMGELLNNFMKQKFLLDLSYL